MKIITVFLAFLISVSTAVAGQAPSAGESEVPIITTAPYPPEWGFSPSWGMEIRTLLPLIYWGEASDPDSNDESWTLHYICQVCTEVGKGGLVILATDTTSVAQTWFQVTDSLPDNSYLFYRIKTVDDDGEMSPWSESILFWTNVADESPQPFPIISPDDNFKIVEQNTIFSWYESYDRDPLDQISYSLEVSENPEFYWVHQVASRLTNVSTIIPTDSLGAPGSYYWRVIVTDNDGMSCIGGVPEGPRIITILPPGDANSNGTVNGLDVTFLINYFKVHGPDPDPLLAGDANGNCVVNGLDVVYLVNYLKSIGPAPVRPSCQN
jgi:hypothetical protein